MRGVTFGAYHTYKDFGLYMKTAPIVSAPAPKLYYVDIPGADGAIDMSEVHAGRVTYENREISMTFVVINGRERWAHVYSKLMNAIHGKEMRIVLDGDPEYYYFGRPIVQKMDSGKKTADITITATVQPYKRSVNGTTDDWVWDNQDFENGIIYDYDDVLVEGENTIPLIVYGMNVTPVITVSSDMTLTVNDCEYSMTAGENKQTLKLFDGMNMLKFTGNGHVKIEYRQVTL